MQYSPALVAPVVLTLTTALVFYFGRQRFGNKTGYLTGFLFYWLCWCLWLPFVEMNHDYILALLRPVAPAENKYGWLDFLCLFIPLLFAYAYAFPKALKNATTKIILVSILLSIVNASLEEILWRGLYYQWLGSSPIQYILISSVGFSIWHLSPQIIFPNSAPGGRLSFLAFAFVLGILFSIVVSNTGSIFAVIICHILFDFSGLGARIYFSNKPN